MKKMIKQCLNMGSEVSSNFVKKYRGVYSMCILEHLIESGKTLDDSSYFCENVCEVKSMCELALCTCLL